MSVSLTRITDLRSLTLGDTVQASRFGSLHYRGRVEATAPALGVVWIRDDATGCRAMLHGNVFEVSLLRPALQFAA
ncbi:hypothetical protein ACQ3I4_06495 [Zafaria sp. Z1313]|uniref:hypothetical protein n=1 Tax=unclassified Zafaria TaxID=2828765 RepID=UPI002E772CF0|nr:hypothetical protein [Zafaria sp. J156]MEE1621606.1 hypothetical protein [Zafaria sp. J156]